MRNQHKGQSTVEYIVLVTAVIGVAIAFTTVTFKPKLINTMEGMSNQTVDMVDRLDRATATQAAATSPTAPITTPLDKGEGQKCAGGTAPVGGKCPM